MAISRGLVDGDGLSPAFLHAERTDGLPTVDKFFTLDLGVPVPLDSISFYPPQSGLFEDGRRQRALFPVAYEVSRANTPVVSRGHRRAASSRYRRSIRAGLPVIGLRVPTILPIGIIGRCPTRRRATRSAPPTAESFSSSALKSRPPTLVSFKIFSSNMFFGNIRLPVWPALPHLLRIFSLRRQPKRVVVVVAVAFVVGFVVAAWATISMAYGLYDQIAHIQLNPRVADPGKWGIYLLGFFEAAGLAFLRGRFHWFSLHPLGLAYQATAGTSIYWFSLLLVWLAKLVLLRYGGIRAYRTGKPFFFGLGIGYVIGVVFSGVVDMIWFRGQMHVVHDW